MIVRYNRAENCVCPSNEWASIGLGLHDNEGQSLNVKPFITGLI